MPMLRLRAVLDADAAVAMGRDANIAGGGADARSCSLSWTPTLSSRGVLNDDTVLPRYVVLVSRVCRGGRVPKIEGMDDDF